jgi:hypothetical protein
MARIAGGLGASRNSFLSLRLPPGTYSVLILDRVDSYGWSGLLDFRSHWLGSGTAGLEPNPGSERMTLQWLSCADVGAG